MAPRKIKKISTLVKQEKKLFFGESKNIQRDIRIYIVKALWKALQFFLVQTLSPLEGYWNGLGGVVFITIPFVVTGNHVPLGVTRFLNGDFFDDLDKALLNVSSFVLLGLNFGLILFWPAVGLATKYAKKQR